MGKFKGQKLTGKTFKQTAKQMACASVCDVSGATSQPFQVTRFEVFLISRNQLVGDLPWKTCYRRSNARPIQSPDSWMPGNSDTMPVASWPPRVFWRFTADCLTMFPFEFGLGLSPSNSTKVKKRTRSEINVILERNFLLIMFKDSPNTAESNSPPSNPQKSTARVCLGS